MEFGTNTYRGRTGSLTSQLSDATLQKGDDGTPAPYLKVQYSNNDSDWFDTPGGVTGDVKYLRFSNDNGSTWSSSVELSVGPAGSDGENGENVMLRYGVATYGSDLLSGAGTFASATGWSTNNWSISGGVAQATNPTLPAGTGLYHTLSSNTSDGDDLSLEFDVTQSSDNNTYFIVRFLNSSTFATQDIYYWDDGGYIETGHYEFNFQANGEYDQLRIMTGGNNGTTVTIDNISIKGLTITYSDTPSGNVEYIKISTDGGSTYTNPIQIGWKVNTVKIQFKDSTDPGDSYSDTYQSGDDVMRISKDGGINWIEGIQILGDDGSDGADGDSAYVYIAYASDDSGTGCTTTFDADLDYIAVLTKATEISSPSKTDFTGLWKKYKGKTGTSQYTFIGYATDSTGGNATLTPEDGVQYQYVAFLVKDEDTTPDMSEFSGLWRRFYGYAADNFLEPVNGHDGGYASVNPATIGDITYTDGGGSQDDMTVNEVFTGWSDTDYVVQIDGTGTPNTFEWSKDGGSTWEDTDEPITGSAQTLEKGVEITFAETTGHASGDKWEWTAEAPDDGDRYILEDVSTQGATYHSSFGTIDKDTDGEAITLQDNDIVEADVSNEEFRVVFDANDYTSDRSVNVTTDKNGETNRLWTYFHDTGTWEDMGEAYQHANLPDIYPQGVANARNHLTDTQIDALTQNNGDIDNANNFHYHTNAAEESFTNADQESYRVIFTHNLDATRLQIFVYDGSGNEIPSTHYQVQAKGSNDKYIKFQGDIPSGVTYWVTAIKPNIDSP